MNFSPNPPLNFSPTLLFYTICSIFFTLLIHTLLGCINKPITRPIPAHAPTHPTSPNSPTLPSTLT